MLERPIISRTARRLALRRERDRRHRERVKQGRMVALVELDGTALDWLVRIHWLTEPEANQGDARIIGEAIARGLKVSAGG